MPSSRGFSWPRDWTQVSHLVGRFFNVWATKNEAMHFLCIASCISPLCFRQQEDSNSKSLGLVFHPRKQWELSEDRDKTGLWMFFWILALIFTVWDWYRMQLEVIRFCASNYVPSRVPSPKKAPLQGLSQCSPRLVSAYRVPDHCLRTEWAGVASPRKRGFCASISSCLQEGLTDCCTSSRLSCPGVSVNQDFLILNGEVPTSFWHICLSWLSCSSNTKSRKDQCEALGNQAFKYLIQEPSNQETFDTTHPHLKPHSINFNLTPYKNIPTVSFCFVPEIETYILSYNNQLHPLKHLNPLEELSSLLPSPPIPIPVNFPRDMQSQIFPLAAVLVIFSHQAGKIISLFPMFASKWLQLKMDDYNGRLKSGGVESKKPHGRI